MQLLNNKLYTLADRQNKHTINKNNSINIDIQSYKINNKHYVIATKDKTYISFLKDLLKHDYYVSYINIYDISNYCKHTNNNLIIVDNMYCNIDTKISFVETSIIDFNKH